MSTGRTAAFTSDRLEEPLARYALVSQREPAHHAGRWPLLRRRGCRARAEILRHVLLPVGTGPGGSVALLHRSGPIIARYPDHERGVGLSLANERLFVAELPAGDNGAFVDASKVDGQERLFSYRAVTPLPLVVVVGLSREVLLADWWNKLKLSGMAIRTFVAAMLVGLVLFLQRRLDDLAATARLRQIEKTEALGRMTSSIAHDFNNILTVISGNLELLARRLPTGDVLQNRAMVALDAAGQGARMVGQLLAFARRDPLEATCERPDRLVADMSELLRQAAQPCEVSSNCRPTVGIASWIAGNSSARCSI